MLAQFCHMYVHTEIEIALLEGFAGEADVVSVLKGGGTEAQIFSAALTLRWRVLRQAPYHSDAPGQDALDGASVEGAHDENHLNHFTRYFLLELSGSGTM